jgi:hypothetical protein
VKENLMSKYKADPNSVLMGRLLLALRLTNLKLRRTR